MKTMNSLVEWVKMTKVIALVGLMLALRVNANEALPIKYLLRPGDKVSFRLVEDPANTAGDQTVLEVNQMGELKVPISHQSGCFLGVNARGLSVDELKASVKAALERNYYKTATVQMDLAEKRTTTQRVTLCGDIQGIIFLNRGINTTLAKAVKFFEPSLFADLSKVQVTRQNPDGTVTVLTINVDKILKNNMNQDLELQNGDIIYVARSIWQKRKPENMKELVARR